MSFQTLFLKFHETIKLNNANENATLREKRDIILDKLRARLDWSFTSLNQGSYAMSIGIEPLNGDYDIDVGLVFSGEPRDILPHTLKGKVYQALKDHTQTVIWQRPCITVQYQRENEPLYHVDLPVYLKDERGRLYLALGKEHSSADLRLWEASDPIGFIEQFRTRQTGQNAEQLRRVVRALKRWKDVHFAPHGQAAPRGIALCIAAYEYFKPIAHTYNPSGASQYDDLSALQHLVQSLQQQLGWSRRLSLRMPVTPHDDVCARMTDQQQLELKGALDKLALWLNEAQRTSDPRPLQRAFGSDFPLR